MDKGFHVFATDDEIRKKPDEMQPIQPSFGSFNGGWIKCSERLPEIDTTVLVYAYVGYNCGRPREKKIYSAFHTNSWGRNGWYVDCDCSGLERETEYLEPIFWMPLPKLPEEE